MVYNSQANQNKQKEEVGMNFMISKNVMAKAEDAAIDMVKTGEQIRQIKIGRKGKIYISSDQNLVNWIKTFNEGNVTFFIGAKK